MTFIKVILAPSLELAKTIKAHVTVEAEYGSTVIEGSVLTLAHHQKTGPYSPDVSPAPCNNGKVIADSVNDLRKTINKESVLIVLISHLDLDTVGGVLRVLHAITGLPGDDIFSENEPFWNLAEFVDLNGPHKLASSGASPDDIERLYAYWVCGKNGSLLCDEITDVTGVVLGAFSTINRIFDGDDALIAAGQEFREAGDQLNKESLVDASNDVIVRSSDSFVNHLYTTAGGFEGKAVVSLNTKTNSITVSFADDDGPSAREIVQSLWGPDAGGRNGIAGSPRGREMNEGDRYEAFAAVAIALSR